MKKPLQKKDMNHLYKVTAQLRNVGVLLWATFVAYIVYAEFIKDLVTIL